MSKVNFLLHRQKEKGSISYRVYNVYVECVEYVGATYCLLHFSENQIVLQLMVLIVYGNSEIEIVSTYIIRFFFSDENYFPFCVRNMFRVTT